MKRTVKAWVWLWNRDGGEGWAYASYDFVELRYREYHKLGRIVPCTITYDDGKKPKRKK